MCVCVCVCVCKRVKKLMHHSKSFIKAKHVKY